MVKISGVRWALFASVCLVANAFGAGHSVHIQMSKQAVGQVDDPVLKSILQTYRPQWVIGSALPDGGYLNGYPYAETSHWSGFHRAYFNRIKRTCPPDQLVLEKCKKLVAHFMGMVAHGVEDEIYDTLMMSLSDKVDGKGGDHLATSKDTVVDKYTLFDYQGAADVIPVAVSPLEDVYLALKSIMNAGLSRDHLRVGQGNIIAAAVLERQLVNPLSNVIDSRLFPWLRQNYRDGIGGIEYAGLRVARVWDYFWAKLKGDRMIEPQFSVYPEPGGTVGLDSTIGRGRFIFVADRPWQYFDIDRFYLEKALTDGSWQRIPAYGDKRYDGYVHAIYPRDGFTAGDQYRAVLRYAVKDEYDHRVVYREKVWEATASAIP